MRCTGLPHPFCVGLPPLNQAPGVVFPVMESAVLVNEASAFEGLDKLRGVSLERAGFRNFLGVKVAQVTVLGVFQCPPPQQMQVPYCFRQREIQRLAKSERLGVTGQRAV